MKVVRIIAAGLIMTLSLSGCDFFRSLAGKPTSAEIEALRLEQEKKEKMVRDSIAAAQAEAERLAAEASIESAPKEYPFRFYVIVGSFLDSSNAPKMAAQMKKNGYETTEFEFKDGFHAVGVSGTDNLGQAVNKANDLFNLDCTPYDIWVYDTRTNQHK